MNDFEKFNLRTFAIGIVLAVTIFFILAAVMLTTSLVWDLYHAEKRDLSAIATLVGNMIGAVFSGLMAAGAAFGAVELQRRHAEQKERDRRSAIATPIRHWCETLVHHVGSLVEHLSVWVKHEADQNRVPHFTGTFMRDISGNKCDKTIRARVEEEFALEERIIGRVVNFQGYFETAGPSALEEIVKLTQPPPGYKILINGVPLEENVKRTQPPPGKPEILGKLIDIMQATRTFLGYVDLVHALIHNGSRAPNAIDIDTKLEAAIAEARRRRDAYARQESP